MNLFAAKIFGMIAALTIQSLTPIVVKLLIVVLAVWLLFWLMGFLGMPEPLNKFIRAFITILFVLWLISMLLGLFDVSLP